MHAVSYLTAEEIIEAAGKAGMSHAARISSADATLARRVSAVSRSEFDADERDTDDVTPEEIEAAKRWATMGRVHKAEPGKGQKK